LRLFPQAGKEQPLRIYFPGALWVAASQAAEKIACLATGSSTEHLRQYART
jgi:hypothetical protein